MNPILVLFFADYSTSNSTCLTAMQEMQEDEYGCLGK